MTLTPAAPLRLTRPPGHYPLVTTIPTGEVQPPFILIEGGEKTGKSWSVAEATGDPRISFTWWIEWAEKPCAEEYGKIPGARYEIVRHDGTFWAVLSLVEQISSKARELITAEQAPMLVIDTGAGEWNALKALAHARTMASPSVRGKIARNPGAAADNHPIPMNTWTDIGDLHRELITLLQNFPGIVVVISRGKEIAAVDASGHPIPGERTYRVEGHKDLGFDVSAWVRMYRNSKPVVVGARSVRAPLWPGVDAPRPYQGLMWLIFDILQYKPKPWSPPETSLPPPAAAAKTTATSTVAPGPEPAPAATASPPAPPPVDWAAELARAQHSDSDNPNWELVHAELGRLWNAAQTRHHAHGDVPDDVIDAIREAGTAAKTELWRQRLTAPECADPETMHATVAKAVAAGVDVERIIAELQDETTEPANAPPGVAADTPATVATPDETSPETAESEPDSPPSTYAGAVAAGAAAGADH